MVEPWRQQLREARLALRISQRELAGAALVSEEAVRAYELGRRRPSRQQLEAILDALKPTDHVRNEIMRGAGYEPPPTLFPNWRFPNYFYGPDELGDAVEQVPWPEFVLDNNAECIAANTATQALWQIDFAAERAVRTRAQMSILAVASDHHFGDRVVNWDECVQVMAAVLKGQPRAPESLDDPSAYFNAVLAEFVDGDAVFLSRLLRIFAETPAREPKCRWTYPVVWKDPQHGTMRFLATVSTASEPDGFGFNDWIPVDAESWGVLERVKSRHRESPPRG